MENPPSREDALRLRLTSGQPIHWPDGVAMPIDRVAVTRFLMRLCAEEDLDASWTSVLPETDPDAGFAVEDLSDRIFADLRVNIDRLPPDARFGDLVARTEAAMLEYWPAVLALASDPERMRTAARDAVVRVNGGEGALAQPDGRWGRIAPPWDEFMPAFVWRLAPDWWRRPALGWWAVGSAAVAFVILRWMHFPGYGGWFMSVLLAAVAYFSAVAPRLMGPVWPPHLRTVDDLAAALAQSLTDEIEHVRNIGNEP